VHTKEKDYRFTPLHSTMAVPNGAQVLSARPREDEKGGRLK